MFFLVIILQFLIFVISTDIGIAEILRTECSGSTVNISCDVGVIAVHKVLYGQSESCYYDPLRCRQEHLAPHPCSGTASCSWKVPMHHMEGCGPSHYVQLSYDCLTHGMAEDGHGPVLQVTLAADAGLSHPQASIQERQDDPDYDYDYNITSSAVSDQVLYLAKKNDPEKWATIAGGIIAGIAVILLVAIVIIMIIEKQRSKPQIPTPDYDDDVSINGTNDGKDSYENINIGYKHDEDDKTSNGGNKYETIPTVSQVYPETHLPQIGESSTSDVEQQRSTPTNSMYQNIGTSISSVVHPASRTATPTSPMCSTMLRINYEDPAMTEPVLDWNSISAACLHIPSPIPEYDVQSIHAPDTLRNPSRSQSRCVTIPGCDHLTDAVIMVENDLYEVN